MQIPKQYFPVPAVKIKHPEWCRSSVLYQINTRQFTPEGTFRAAELHLPRLKKLGVDILWLMPIHEIGMKNRKGSLGSPYAVRDYCSVNREFGTIADLTSFVRAAHECGMRVIIDWVANHTAWDCPLAVEHPDWYARDWKGDFRPSPWRDWDDIIELDYSVPALRQYMAEAMKFWIRETDIDGFRCDVAGFVPTDFWNVVRTELDAMKPVFMLAEWESRDLHTGAFDATYSWSWFEAVRDIVAGRCDLEKLFMNSSHDEKAFPPDSLRMLFVTNHDKNAWEGTEFEIFGDAVNTAIVLSMISEGIPLIYNGQEAGNNRRLAFFEKDSIAWNQHPHGDLYAKLIALKKQNSALWNGLRGGRMIRVMNSDPGLVLSFVRKKNDDSVFAVFNLSGKIRQVQFTEGPFHGTYTDFFSGELVTFPQPVPLRLEPWGYRLFVNR